MDNHDMIPAGFVIDDLMAFDDEALRWFLDPGDGGIDPVLLGHALHGVERASGERVAACLPPLAAVSFRHARDAAASNARIAGARRRVLDRLFWPLVYWHRPDDFESLISGERIPDRVLDELDLSGATVCDIGAGTGRFTIAAAPRARNVVAVDAVPVLLRRLSERVAAAKIANVEIRRGSFAALPLDDGAVDVAVACSSFAAAAPHGGERALLEAERIVRPGGRVAVIWPHDPAWFARRGYAYTRVRGNETVDFADVETAVRLCETYYSAAAAGWVREHGTARVPYTVLGVRPPNDLCIKEVTPSR